MNTKKQLHDRKMMELAIEVMRQSVPEPRGDGKASPKVGAVLVKLDGTIETACRGELRHGDHAEFTLLERKNRGKKLDGSTLFATLEPCAPGARGMIKTDCAERIRLARIKKVWVGQETESGQNSGHSGPIHRVRFTWRSYPHTNPAILAGSAGIRAACREIATLCRERI